MAATIDFDATIFRAAFPMFDNKGLYCDATLEAWWNTASLYISTNNYGSMRDDSRRQGISLMMAHLMWCADLVKGGEVPGRVTSSSIDKISVTLESPPSKDQWSWWLSLSPYGQQLLALLSQKAVGGMYIGGRPEGSAFRRVHGRFG
jgi:hypothetical protein